MEKKKCSDLISEPESIIAKLTNRTVNRLCTRSHSRPWGYGADKPCLTSVEREVQQEEQHLATDR